MKWLFALFCSLPLLAATIYNGQTLIIPFKKEIKTKLKYTTIHHLAIIPTSYYARPKTLSLTIDGRPIKLTILKKHYPKERLHVAPSKVKPPQKLLQKIKKEFAEARRIYTTTTPKSYINKPFILPIKSTITDPFGVARIFNGQLKSYHSGTDFRAKVGTPIKAINDGVVVLAQRRYYAGNSIIIDHGRGIYSCYFHLSRYTVKAGKKVKRGEVIGLSGKSGRVTGPHLHLTIKVLGTTVDPMQFIRSFNKHFQLH